MRATAAILPMTLLASCQMDQANEAMRGMSDDRMAVARVAFAEMETDELAGMLMLSEEIAETCARIDTNTQVHVFLSSRVERVPFRDPEVSQMRLDTARGEFAAKHGIDATDADMLCPAARSEILALTSLGATLMEGPAS